MSRVDGPVIKFSGKIGSRSEKAVQFTIHDEDGIKPPTWFPLSQTSEIHNTFSVINNTLDTIVVTRWIAEQKNLIEKVD